MAIPEMEAFLTLLGVVIGGGITYLVERQRNKHEFDMLKETHKTDFMAETTARHFLLSDRYTDRSFDMLKERLGGFEDNEIRKILVRAGAIRLVRKDGSEWWRLLDRMPEYVEKKRKKEQAKKESEPEQDQQ